MGFFVVFDSVRNSVLTAWPNVFHVSSSWESVPPVANLVGWEVSGIKKSARFVSEQRAVNVARTVATHFQENNEEVDFKVLKLSTQVEERCEEIVLL